jgi:hypothetical protein
MTMEAPQSINYKATADFSLLHAAFDRTRAFMADLEAIFNPDKALPPLIGFGGLKRHGKDAAADMLVHNRGYVKTFMSEPLTAAVSLIGPRGPWVRLDFDVPTVGVEGDFIRYAHLVELVGYTAAKEHRDAREYLQGLGTEVGRNMIHEDIWTDMARKKIQEARAAGHPVVITGIRYQNEIDLVRELGGLTAWVERTSWPEKPSHPLTDAIDEALGTPQEDTTASHSSETSLKAEDFDVFIENGGTLLHLRDKMLSLHAELTQR